MPVSHAGAVIRGEAIFDVSARYSTSRREEDIPCTFSSAQHYDTSWLKFHLMYVYDYHAEVGCPGMAPAAAAHKFHLGLIR